uniref:prepilin-type N-terminal cleavage/methylation domain-containing protein n=1 Tax=Nocardioides sp. TaxID=35761 RepID=UPI0035657EBE
MIARLQKSMNEKDKGFTLVELLVVIVIIGILAGIAIPLFLSQRKKGVDAGVKSDLKALATIEET